MLTSGSWTSIAEYLRESLELRDVIFGDQLDDNDDDPNPRRPYGSVADLDAPHMTIEVSLPDRLFEYVCLKRTGDINPFEECRYWHQ